MLYNLHIKSDGAFVIGAIIMQTFTALVRYQAEYYNRNCGAVMPATWYGEIDNCDGALPAIYSYEATKSEVISFLITALKSRGFSGKLRVVCL